MREFDVVPVSRRREIRWMAQWQLVWWGGRPSRIRPLGEGSERLESKDGSRSYFEVTDATTSLISLPAIPITSEIVPPNIMPNRPTFNCET